MANFPETHKRSVREALVRVCAQIVNSSRGRTNLGRIVDFWEDAGIHHMLLELLQPETEVLEGDEYALALDEFESSFIAEIESHIAYLEPDMAKQTAKTPETRTFRMHPHLLFDVIRRQAGTLLKAILEGVMNAVDAKATEITITLDKTLLRITDNGTGITEKAAIERYWETFGQPPEAHEAKTYGQFRMGRGQLFAFGCNTWKTGPFQMYVDIWNKGLDYQLTEVEKALPGCDINVMLYNPLLPSDMDQTLRELAIAIKYVPAKIVLNGKEVTTDVEGIEWDHVLPEAYIRLKQGGNMYVYNLGVLVCSHPAHTFGCGGEVVSRKQLRVNFARNEEIGRAHV